MVVAALGAFTYRGYVDNRDIIDSRDLVLQSRSETRDLRVQLADQTAQRTALQAKLDNGVDAGIVAANLSPCSSYTVTMKPAWRVRSSRWKW